MTYQTHRKLNNRKTAIAKVKKDWIGNGQMLHDVNRDFISQMKYISGAFMSIPLKSQA